MADQPFFMHSRCCMAHWELVLKPDGKAELVCEKCGASAGPQVTVTLNIDPKTIHCEHCGG